MAVPNIANAQGLNSSTSLRNQAMRLPNASATPSNDATLRSLNQVVLQRNREQQPGPTVRAAVPAIGVDNESKRLLVNRAIQPILSPSPYLEADETLGITSPENRRQNV